MKPRPRRSPARPASTSPTGHMSAEVLEQMAREAYPNAVQCVANMPDNVARSKVLQAYQAQAGKEAADRLRGDVWALMQGVRAPA